MNNYRLNMFFGLFGFFFGRALLFLNEGDYTSIVISAIVTTIIYLIVTLIYRPRDYHQEVTDKLTQMTEQVETVIERNKQLALALKACVEAHESNEVQS